MQIKVPGKLYISGEYAVVENGQSAILVAIDRFVFADITANLVGEIHSTQAPTEITTWTLSDNEIILQETPSLTLINAALKVTYNYFRLHNWPFQPFKLLIDSQLDADDGTKYGLGSSAAVCVSVVKAILAFHFRHLPTQTIYKLASLAHFTIQKNGSLGDVAASVYTGWISYNSPNRTWLSAQTADLLDATLVDQSWPDLNIQSIPAPNALSLLVGWTGSPAKTGDILKKIDRQKYPAIYQDFLIASNAAVSMIINGLLTNNYDDVVRGIALNREFLLSLSQAANLQIETPLLRTLIEIANNLGGAAKTSGAGFGDSGIALVDEHTNVDQILISWQAAGIIPLSVKPYHESIAILAESEE
ncbi:phosphomevalonate kinase [Periweissella beninensis]|uniref:phosphomevalonate kinase n=1 Tax=Periweissella beninensis TaxID=504936 RepID=UPI0021A5FE64|nr:phosphomevalonate kinase [Periweissella beninensis]MCT4396548.1 phosphomevalonate kinase [Periweissella beninensis]